MIRVIKSPTADTRSCDPTTVVKSELLKSSISHMNDVDNALLFIINKFSVLISNYWLRGLDAIPCHDADKVTDIDGFHRDFIAANEKPFVQGEWYKNHLRLNRHHLNVEDGIPKDVNLIDVIEHIADTAVAGMARSGDVYPINLSPELLENAVQNTLKLLLDNIEVE